MPLSSLLFPGKHPKTLSKTLLCIAVAWTLSTCPVLAQHQTKEKESVTLNFVNADIQSVIKTVGMITNKNFILDPRVNGTINIVSNGPVAKELVYPTLLAALRLQGFSAVEQPGGFVKILPESEAKTNYTVTTDKLVKNGDDRIVTQVYQLQYENAGQLVAVLRPLINPQNTIASYASTNTLIITDYATNLQRINKIIQSIDQPSQGEITDIKLQYASAVDVAQLLTRLVPETSQQPNAPGIGPKVIVTVEPRSNTLYIRSDNPSYANRIKALVIGMDTPTATPGNVHVVYLRNAEATKVAETLRSLLAGGSGPTSIGAAAAPAASNPSLSGMPNATQPSAPAAPASQPAVASTIQAYAATNSLVIIAPDHLYNQLRSVIDKLDARRAQVFVEALIVEVTTDLASEFGIQWQDLTGINRGGVNAIGGTNFGSTNIIGASQNITSVGAGLNVGVVKGTITIPGVNGGNPVLNLGALAHALETDSQANVLSTPNILTLDNEEAKIVVGNNVPFVTGSYAQTGTTNSTGSVNPFQTIERRDIGIQLKVKPQVAEGGAVKLQIFQEVSDVDNTINTNGAGLATTKRSIESTILIDDGQIVVIGGLIKDRLDNGKAGVPGLSRIPILGALFRNDSRRHQKTNLMVFLRPYILRDDKAANVLTGERYEYIRNEQAKTQPGPHLLLPHMDTPTLPDLPVDNSPKKPAANLDYQPPAPQP